MPRALVLPTILLTVPSLFLMATRATADPSDARPRILLHRAAVASKNPCSSLPLTDCSQAATAGSLTAPGGAGQYVYVLARQGDTGGIYGFGFWIDYQDGCPNDRIDGRRIDILQWRSCGTGDVELAPGNWPEPGAGILLSWTGLDCRTDPLVLGGYFYLSAYAADTLSVIERSDGNRNAVLVDCAHYAEHPVPREDLGSVIFSAAGTSEGCNPCNGPCAPPYPPTASVYCTPPPPPPPPPPSGSPKVMLHLASVVTKNPCAAGALPDCQKAVTSGVLSDPSSGPFYYLYLLGVPGTGVDIAGIETGIDYESGLVGDASNGSGVDIFSWTLCASLQFIRVTPNPWPAPGGANIVVWDRVNNCQNGATAVAGYFYMGAYSADRFRLIGDYYSHHVIIGDCTSEEHPIPEEDWGFVDFSAGGKAPGCNPCVTACVGAVPVRPTTWSHVKTLFAPASNSARKPR